RLFRSTAPPLPALPSFSLHAALPISGSCGWRSNASSPSRRAEPSTFAGGSSQIVACGHEPCRRSPVQVVTAPTAATEDSTWPTRSEEHTSEPPSPTKLLCPLLPLKKH